jgi:hypothetical protein
MAADKGYLRLAVQSTSSLNEASRVRFCPVGQRAGVDYDEIAGFHVPMIKT